MDSWLAIFGWFLVASAFLPVLLLVGIVIVSGCQWAWIWAYDLWLRRQERRIEDTLMRIRLQEAVTADPELQALILIDELEEFLESQS